MSNNWYNSLPEHTKRYLDKQPLWHDRDLYKVGIVAALIGFILGVLVGYEWAWTPVITTFRPLIG